MNLGKYKMWGSKEEEKPARRPIVLPANLSFSPYKLFGAVAEKTTQGLNMLGHLAGGDPKEATTYTTGRGTGIKLPNIDPTGFIGSTARVGENVVKKTAPAVFEGFQDLSTKLLEKLKGKSVTSKQEIADFTNAPDLKQAEKDLFRRMLEDEGDKIDIPTFANKVKSELLPLTTKEPKNISEYRGQSGRYESVNLPDELRGPVANYKERVYESPIKTSAGEVHFSGARGSTPENYFAHTRIEDLPATGVKGRMIPPRNMSPEGRAAFDKRANELAKTGDTRRVIEIQSDLFQKGRLEGERGAPISAEYKLNGEIYTVDPYSMDTQLTYLKELGYQVKTSDLKFNYDESKLKELAKLEPYRNTWHERVIREEVKQAAKDGKTKLQFPTGETAMKIEGLGDNSHWIKSAGDENYRVEPNELKVGLQIQQANEYGGQGSDWIITDVLGDGKFKAVPKDAYDHLKKTPVPTDEQFSSYERLQEEFDISGKVDTENPIYKFYEKNVQKYLTNKYGGKVITDPQGVKWVEVDVKPEMANKPIEAYAAAPLGMGEALKEFSKTEPEADIEGTSFVQKERTPLDKLLGRSEIERKKERVYTVPDRNIKLNDEDIDELKHILYGEVSNRPKDKKQLEARVIINTALNRVAQKRARGQNVSLADVLREPNQYQAYKGKQYSLSKSGKGDAEKAAAIDEVLEELKAGGFEDDTHGAVFYIHNDDGSIKYDDETPLYAKK